MDTKRLSIVDEKGVVVGEASRKEIHARGLLHQDVHIWFYTPDGSLVFQRRGATAETYAGMLDATVGGHVEIGATYDETALKETEEETGVKVTGADLQFVGVSVTRAEDPASQTVNHHRRHIYVYRYEGVIEALQTEEGKGAGFALLSPDITASMPAQKFAPTLLDDELPRILNYISRI